MWVSVVSSLIDNDTRYHSGQNVLDTNFDCCGDVYRTDKSKDHA